MRSAVPLFFIQRLLASWSPAGFLQGWAMRGSEGRKSPCRVQGELPGGILEAKPTEADNISQNDA